MASKIVYELPEDNKKVSDIVGVIPADWCWIDGRLTAPKQLYRELRVAKNTRLKISRFYSIKPSIIGSDDVAFEDYWFRI